MKKIPLFLLTTAALIFAGCQAPVENPTVSSPSNVNSIEFFLDASGSPYYRVKHGETVAVDSSAMGFDFQGQPPLKSGLKILRATERPFDETWEMPWGEQRTVRNHYNELLVELEETEAPNRKWNIYFRAYDDGIAFRYEFPAREGVDTLIILDENTEFQLAGDHDCWWIPADYDSYEHLYNTTKFSEIDAIAAGARNSLGHTSIPQNAVHTPVTMKSGDGLYLSFHEAALTDYASMTLKVGEAPLLMASELVGSDRFGYKVKRALPFRTPWRTVQIADKATGLIASRLIVNLNEPNVLGDVDWVKPMKYVGIWWEMHLDRSKWDYASGKHGATTENAKRYIDFAAANNIGGLLVEGWNTGWEYWTDPVKREGVFDFVTPYPDYDLQEVVRYGKEKGVELIMHHETSASVETYDQQLDTAYALMESLGIHAVKTGYVGKIIPRGEYHHGQWMVNHYRRVLETAARHKVAVNAHEPIKPTGIRRTYPNAIAREGLRGQEFNAWSNDGGNPPEHLSIVAFTRMLAGPIDFTPGVFEISLRDKPNNQVNTTLAHQLALYVVVYSPIQMACDLPENYEGQPAFQFIRDVGVDWEQTLVLDGEVGDFVTIARQEKGTGNWFLGCITDEDRREATIDFSFLEAGKKYRAAIYRDGPNAHYRDNPLDIAIEEGEMDHNSSLSFTLAEGGGLVISLKRVE
ncbi:MAG: glycoside hydrolase family 97 protein [Lewinellaceae bacterium]|nr:glycoside hydrolase family 97 protein [Lewinellaceae bacterium]